MRKRIKSFINKLYTEIRYQSWKAKIFTTRNDPRVKKMVQNEMFHQALMNRVCSDLDRQPKHIPSSYDEHPTWFAGTIPHDWENRIEERIKSKERN